MVVVRFQDHNYNKEDQGNCETVTNRCSLTISVQLATRELGQRERTWCGGFMVTIAKLLQESCDCSA